MNSMTDVRNKCQWSGVFAATLCPFHEDYSLDEDGLREYLRWVASFPGMCGLVANGHTGEIMSLRPEERARVTKITAEEVGNQTKVVSGVSCEGSLEAIDHALAAKEGLSMHQIAFIGDDINDLPALHKVGLSACPADALAAVKEKVHYICKQPGGGGCTREFIDLIITLRQV